MAFYDGLFILNCRNMPLQAIDSYKNYGTRNKYTFFRNCADFIIAMAVPPRFPGMFPAYGVQIPQMTPMSKFLKHMNQF